MDGYFSPMDLDQQIQALIQDAPQDGTTPKIVQAIAPALKQVAQRLRHTQYYILQSAEDRRWLSTTLQNQTQLGREKTVIYAFADRQDAIAGVNPLEVKPAIAELILVVPLLFQMVTLDPIESMIFFEVSGNTETGTEIFRQEVEALIQARLQSMVLPQPGKDIPPDLA